MSDEKSGDQVPALFATIHHRGPGRPEGYTNDDIANLNRIANQGQRAAVTANVSMLEARALEIWNVIGSVKVAYDWPIGAKARERLDALIGHELECWSLDDEAARNRRVREIVGEALRDPLTTSDQAGALYDWIVAEWGGVRKGREVVPAWAHPSRGWHGDYSDAKLLAYADDVDHGRVASWSKIFAFAAPDRHAIYDSRVAVALNLALERLGEKDRFFMPSSRTYRDKQGVERPNAIALARKRLTQRGDKPALGYRDYLGWLAAVRSQSADRGESLDFLDIESAAFSAAPLLALGASK